MADQGKPYKVYRGGRAKGPIRPPGTKPDGRGSPGKAPAPEQPKAPKRRRRFGPRRTLGFLLLGVLLLTAVWTLLGLLAVRRGVEAANDRLPDEAEATLAPSNSILTNPVTTLVIGADNGGRIKERQGAGRADSLILLRTDPDEHRLAYLHIPRDLYVPIPGTGPTASTRPTPWAERRSRSTRSRRSPASP